MANNPDTDALIGQVQLSPTSELVFTLYITETRKLASIRKFRKSPRYTGPTKSGMTVRPSILGDLIQILSEFRKNVPQFQEGEIGRIGKDSETDIVIQVVASRQHKGAYAIDIREHVDADRYQGPTKRGIRFDIDKLDSVLPMLEKQEEALSILLPGETQSLFGDKTTQQGKREDSESSEDQVTSTILSDGPRRFPDDFLSEGSESEDLKIPEEPLELTPRDASGQKLISETGMVLEFKNPAKAKYLYYAHLSGKRVVTIPKTPIDVFKAVKQYEIYLRELKKKLIHEYYLRTKHMYTSEEFTRTVFRKHNLPWFEDEVA